MNDINSAPRVLFVISSKNKKTGPIVASYVAEKTCPDACPLKKAGCYADTGPVNWQWRKTTDPAKSIGWEEYLARLRKAEPGRLFRHGIAGDLPGVGDRLDTGLLADLVNAASKLTCFSYTHKPLSLPEEQQAVANTNARGFTINLSSDNLAEADRKASFGIAPVVTLLPSDTPLAGQIRTPDGRKVVLCPAQTHEEVTCLSCRLCARTGTAAKERVIVGFLSHGTRKKAADRVIRGS
jgi:hypothetical protein